jgi:hypothetical protein
MRTVLSGFYENVLCQQVSLAGPPRSVIHFSDGPKGLKILRLPFPDNRQELGKEGNVLSEHKECGDIESVLGDSCGKIIN